MKKKKMLFIVGAGASNEVGLPVGDVLKRAIASLLDFEFDGFDRLSGGDSAIYNALSTKVQDRFVNLDDIKKYITAAWKIRDAMPLEKSIDHYIDTQRGDNFIESCGKLAIVKSILRAERDSNLFYDSNNPN